VNPERAAKHQQVANYLEEHRLGAVLLSRRCNFSWYTCGARNYVGNACEIGNSWLLVSKGGACVLTNNIEGPRLKDEELGEIELASFAWPDAAERDKVFRKMIGPMRIAVDAPVTGVEAAVLGRDFDMLRWRLSDSEILRYRELCDDTVAAMEGVARAAKAGMSEYELAAALSAALLARSCQPWVTLVAGDDRVEKYRHPLPTEKKVRKYFMLVTCAERGGLLSACTRLASFGPLSRDLSLKHQAVANVDAALISSTRPGVSLGELFELAKAAYAETGYPDQWRLHHQGGSCGYQPREVKAGPGEQAAVLADQAFAWNPSITGTKSEDTIFCRADGCEVLGGKSDWPMIEGRWKGASIPRPDILVL
jgi:antitoxin VapB